MKLYFLLCILVGFAYSEFFVFCPNVIYVVEPTNSSIVQTITGDLSAQWGDVVTDKENEFIFANDRLGNRVIVLDVRTRSVVQRIPVGGTPVHIYYLEWKNEIWTHSDLDGDFDVIHEVNHSLIHDSVRAHINGTGHGKLVYDYDSLGSIAFATNTRETGIFKINLETRETLSFHNFNSSSNPCPGTHGLAYSPINRHGYFECTSSRGTFEFDTDTDQVITTWEFKGMSYASPDGRFIFTVNRADNLVHLLEVRNSSSERSFPDIQVTGGPSRVVFYPKPQGQGTFWAFISLSSAPSLAVVDFDTVIAGNPQVQYISTGLHNSTNREMFLGSNWIGLLSSTNATIDIINANTRTLHGSVGQIASSQRIVYAKYNVPTPTPDDESSLTSTTSSAATYWMSYLLILIYMLL